MFETELYNKTTSFLKCNSCIVTMMFQSYSYRIQSLSKFVAAGNRLFIATCMYIARIFNSPIFTEENTRSDDSWMSLGADRTCRCYKKFSRMFVMMSGGVALQAAAMTYIQGSTQSRTALKINLHNTWMFNTSAASNASLLAWSLFDGLNMCILYTYDGEGL